MSKVFVVPKEIGLGAYEHADGPCCAVGHLSVFLTPNKNARFRSLGRVVQVANKLGVPSGAVQQLSNSNDSLTNNDARRDNLIAWLRKHLPYAEVK